MNSNYIPFETVLKGVILATKNERHHTYQSIDQNNNIVKKYALISENWPSYFINYLGH